MRSPATWKGIERQVAGLYGAQRISLSGGNNKQGNTRSDTTHGRLFIEVKHGKRLLPFGGLWKSVRRLAKAEGKVPVIVLHPLRGEALAVITAQRHAALEDLAHLVNTPAEFKAHPGLEAIQYRLRHDAAKPPEAEDA